MSVSNPIKPNPDSQPIPLVTIPESTYIADLAENAYEKGSTAFLRLKALARVRDVVLRPGKLSKDIVWNRIANHEAILGHTRGKLQESPCRTCIQKIGPFADCVSVTGEFLESENACEPAAKSVKSRKENRAQDFAIHWDGLSGIIRDLITEKIFGVGA
ncbi:unnamed protein product [Tuber aestivum]|uniref:Uncharacterized protein n=1 Tax=Tuber aestivum TaxID=59557 RepID=A0A292Q8A7_9PEZI|nr:unnamed protein product [Tuber aestivum]